MGAMIKYYIHRTSWFGTIEEAALLIGGRKYKEVLDVGGTKESYEEE
ncbi:hypothetical protein [Xanthovirga aplysinae]|nr:hypothetical protein [Xanthovirga aplysinae]